VSTDTAKKSGSQKTETIPTETAVDYYHRDATPPVVHSKPPVNREDALLGVAISAVIAGAVGALAWFGWKADKERQAKLDEEHRIKVAELKAKREELEFWFDRQRSEGKIVIETADGEYMAVPAEAYAQSEIRKRGL
jgi:hypothetical protein